MKIKKILNARWCKLSLYVKYGKIMVITKKEWGNFVMQQAKVRKFTSRLLVVLLTLAMAFDSNIAMAYAASNITLPDNQYLVSQTDNNIAPGIKESHIVSNDKTGNRQNMDYVCEVDLKNTKTTKIIAGYNNYDGNKWGMQTVADQAKAAEKTTGYNVVAAINADFYNMSNGQPMGALVMNGKVHHETNGNPYFAILKDGTAVIRTGDISLDDVQEAIGGNVILVEDGKARDFSNSGLYGESVNPRTVIGIKEDGNVVTLVNDGRNAPISYGRTYQEIADMMEKLGCKIALNLDGGGSATYCSKPEGSNQITCRNNPSDGGERTVSSSLLIVSTAKATGEFDHASIKPNNLVYTPNSEVKFTAKGVDSAGGQAALPSNVSWSLEDSKYGEINSNGIFTSNGTTGEVKVNLMRDGKVVGSTSILIEIPDSITFKNDEVSLGFNKSSNLDIIVKYKGRDVIYKDGDFKWTLSDKSMGTFNGNMFTSSDSATVNGDATATCIYNEKVSGTVHLIIGRLPSVILDFEDKVDDTGKTIPAEKYYSIAKEAPDGKSLLYTMGYGRSGKRDAKIVDLDSGEPVRFGTHALRIDYDFTQATGTEGACIGFSEDGKEIEGNPTGVGMWVYAPEGTPNFWLRIRVKNGSGGVSNLDFTPAGKNGGINWNGWKYVEASLEGQQGPFKLMAGETIRVMYVPPSSGYYTKGATNEDGTSELVEVPKSECKGSIYVDNLQFVYGANVDDIDNPIVDSITANDQEISDKMVINTNTVTFKSLFSDVQNKYTSGIDYDTVRMYIDGVNVSTSNKNCVLVPGDNAINLYDAKLANGPHSIKISLRDKFGNETTETRYFIVKGEENYTSVNLAPTTDKNPVLNKNFELALTTNNIEDVNSVKTNVKINKKFSDFEVKFNDGYEGTSSYDSKSGTISINATRKESATSTGKGSVATITFKIPKELTKGTKFTYCAESGEITYNSEKEDGFTSSFATLQNSLNVDAPLVVKPETMIVGSTGKIYVYDVDGNPVEGSKVLTSDGTSLGTTNSEGYIETDALCKSASKYTIYAQKGEDISYSVSGQSVTSAGNEDGLPEYVISNATSNATNSKNITWMSNPQKSDAKAIMQIAKKSDYTKNGENAFKNVEGTSKLQNFLGSTDVTKNYSARVNKVLATGLSSNTQYVYRVGDGKTWSSVKEFKTVRSGTDTNFFVIGDTQSTDSTNINKIKDKLSEKNYSFGIQTGDAIDDASIYGQWKDILSVFGSDYLGKVDMVHVLGNHEFMGDLDGDAARNIYNLPSENHYSVEYGNVYVGVINYSSDVNKLKSDLEWLKQDAKASKAKWKILTMHQPPYYTNVASNNDLIHELVPSAAEEAGIDFVFSGHDHSYARTEPIKDGKVDEDNGIVYYICGSTGEKSYQVTNNPDFHFVMATQDYNGIYLTVSTTDDKITVTTHEVDGSIIDSYTKTKVKEECKNGHEYVYEGEYLTCKNCGYSRDLGDYTGFATDEKTDKKMYFIDGNFKTGWFTYGTSDIYYFDKNGLAEELSVIEDIKTTCIERGHKIVQNSLGEKKTLKYEIPVGHEFVSSNEGERCSKCGADKYNILSYSINMGTRFEYTGRPITTYPSVTGLRINRDYTVKFENSVEPGEGSVTITGIGKYKGSVKKTFVIYVNISKLQAQLEETSYLYDGKAKEPKVTIEGLTEGKDYTVSYSNNVNEGEAKVIIKGIAPYYSGTITKTFTIEKPSIKNYTVKLSQEVYTYDGEEKEPKVIIEGLTEGKDYTVSYSNNIEPGEAKVTIKGIGEYSGVVEKTFKIEGKIPSDVVDISTYESKISMAKEVEYTGSAVEPKVTIEGLTEGVDYKVTYENNVEMGKAKATIIGRGKYRGTITKTFDITQIDISNCKIYMGTRFEYTGKSITTYPSVPGLRINRDYTVKFENSVEPGEGSVTITGIGKYKGTVERTFTIYRNLSKMEAILSETSYLYDGTAKEPKVTIEGLTEGKDYSLSYANNVNVGEATVTIKGIAPYYTGTVTKTFTIVKQDIDTADLNLQVQNIDLANKQEVKIEDLKEGQDYTVAYNLDQDSNSITIKGIGNYKGQKILKATKDTEMIVEEDGVQYNLLNDGTAEVYNFAELGKKANIKSKIKDYKVTKINKNAFKNCDKLELVKIPKSVSEIDKDVFKDCKNVTISGEMDSYANVYADENKIDFKESK